MGERSRRLLGSAFQFIVGDIGGSIAIGLLVEASISVELGGWWRVVTEGDVSSSGGSSSCHGWLVVVSWAELRIA